MRSQISAATLQSRAYKWIMAELGPVSREERLLRFAEEAVELLQACGLRQERLQLIIRHVYAKPAGSISEEIGDVGLTLSILAEENGVNAAHETELRLVANKHRGIRARQHSKPSYLKAN